MSGMYEVCGHGDCDFGGGRTEYCELQAQDPEGGVIPVIDMLDELLDRGPEVTHDYYAMTTDSAGRFTELELAYMSGDESSRAWPLAETQVDVYHTVDGESGRNTYDVNIGWRMQQAGTMLSHFVTRYIIEMTPGKVVKARIEQPMVVEKASESRPMTEYDYGILFGELEAVYNLYNLESLDNSRVR